MTSTRLLLLGPPGSGKGTQAKILVNKLGVPQVSTGDMLRAAVVAASDVGKLAQAYMDRGDLVPDEVVIEVARERLSQPDCQKGFILDGFPRTRAQAEALDELLSAIGSALEACVSLEVSEDELVARLLKRAELEDRSDDDEETVRNRMRVYRSQTAPLADYYREKSVLRKVDGNGTVEEIHGRVRKALES